MLKPYRHWDPAAPWRLLLSLLAVATLWPGLHLSELDLTVLLAQDSTRAMSQFIASFWPLNTTPEFLKLVMAAALETLAIATAGVAMALIIALPGALLANRVLSISSLSRNGQPVWWATALRFSIRGLLIVLRSVPEVVWALLLVRAVGLGPSAGVLAIAITYSGMLGKVFSEIFESVDTKPSQALLLAGSGRLAAFAYGVLPAAAAEMVSYTVYRWECALRASVVMGFVGAGGLGQQVELSMRLFAGDEIATLLLTFFALALFADQVSRLLRHQLQADHQRLPGGLIATLLLASTLAALASLDLKWVELVNTDSRTQMAAYFQAFLPPQLPSEQIPPLLRAAMETLAMSALGTLLAAGLGLLLALPAAGLAGVLPTMVARLLLNGLRSIPELVWATLMVLAAGLGSNAGTLALALHTGGVLGRLFAEALENTPKEPSQALVYSGVNPAVAFLYGSLPNLWPQWLAYGLYRWENNIRMASVLGFVGAGGLGQMLYVHLSLFQERQAATIILIMLVLILGVDMLSNRMRRYWART